MKKIAKEIIEELRKLEKEYELFSILYGKDNSLHVPLKTLLYNAQAYDKDILVRARNGDSFVWYIEMEGFSLYSLGSYLESKKHGLPLPS